MSADDYVLACGLGKSKQRFRIEDKCPHIFLIDFKFLMNLYFGSMLEVLLSAKFMIVKVTDG